MLNSQVSCNQEHFVVYFVLIFLTVDRSWSGCGLWGVGIPLSLSKALAQVIESHLVILSARGTSNPGLQVLKCMPPRKSLPLVQRSVKHWLSLHLSGEHLGLSGLRSTSLVYLEKSV